MAQPRRSAQLMFPLVETYLAGDQTQKAFCAEHGLSMPVLNYWLKKYRRHHDEGPTTAFVEVTPESEIATMVAPADALLEIWYPHGVRLRLFAPVPPAFLERLLALAVR